MSAVSNSLSTVPIHYPEPSYCFLEAFVFLFLVSRGVVAFPRVDMCLRAEVTREIALIKRSFSAYIPCGILRKENFRKIRGSSAQITHAEVPYFQVAQVVGRGEKLLELI
jgi:hypothetical protein